MRETSFSHPGTMRPVHATVCLLLVCVCVRCEAYASGQTAQSSLAREDDETWLPPVPEELYPPYNYSYAGHGHCDPPAREGEYYHVRCVGPERKLRPGQVSNVISLMASPYPKHGLVEIINQTAQVIDKDGAPVPLSDVYMHHFVGATTFLVESGAEMRGRQQRALLQWPYALVVNGADFVSNKSRVLNVYLISTVGVGEGIGSRDTDRCLQCPCADNPDKGGYACCRDCPSKTPGPPRSYWFEYKVTYRKLSGRDLRSIKPMDLMWYDVTGDDEGIEYQILDTTNETHIKVAEAKVDGGCKQEHEFEIVRCTGHQHIGSRCITMYNADNGDKICQSCPVYGTELGVAGNEKGYVVKMTDDVLSPPYVIKPGTKVRIESAYDGTQRRTGVMGLVNAWVAGLSTPCYREYGYYHYNHYHRKDHRHMQIGSW